MKKICNKTSKYPYVCNGCNQKYKCTLGKQLYDAKDAQKEYEEILSEARTGLTYTEDKINRISKILKPLIVEKGQSIHHAYINNQDSIMCSEKEIYILIDKGILEIKNIDLPRKVRYRSRPKRKSYYKVDKQCLQGRTYQDSQGFIKENEDVNLIEMDAIERIIGGKVLLTIYLVNCSFENFYIF